MMLLYIFFRTTRKTADSYRRLAAIFLIAYYKALSKKQFVIQQPVTIGRGFSIATDLSKTRISICRRLTARKYFNITMGHCGHLTIGENCFFNNNCSINCLGEIVVGANCQFGENVKLYDHNHQHSENGVVISDQGYSIGHIRIGNNCWIGSNVLILKDVTIGDNVVIGAGCIIHKSIETGAIVVNKQELIIKQRNA